MSDVDQDDATGDISFNGDVGEDMSWGFDQSFMGNDGKGTGLEDDEDYDDIWLIFGMYKDYYLFATIENESIAWMIHQKEIWSRSMYIRAPAERARIGLANSVAT